MLRRTLLCCSLLAVAAVSVAQNAVAPEPGYLGLVADDRGEQGQGVRVIEVVEGSPAALAGLQPGDLIVGLNARPVRVLADFIAIVEKAPAGDKLVIDTLRDQRPGDHEVTLGQRPAPADRPFPTFGAVPATTPGAALPGTLAKPLLGVRTETVSDATRRALGLPSAAGALVRHVIPGSPAAVAGIPLDALIIAIAGRPVSNPDDLSREIAAAGPGTRVSVAYVLGGQSLTRDVTLGDMPANASAEAARTWRSQPTADDPSPPGTGTGTLEDRVGRIEQRLVELENLFDRLAAQQDEILQRLRGDPARQATGSAP